MYNWFILQIKKLDILEKKNGGLEDLKFAQYKRIMHSKGDNQFYTHIITGEYTKYITKYTEQR